MKLLKKTSFAITFFMSIIFFVSCSSDNETNDNIVSDIDTASFFKSTMVDEFFLTEVYIGTDSRPLGYMITESATNDALYFMNIEGTNFKVTAFDPSTQNVKHFIDAKDFDLYYGGDNFTPIKVIDDPGFEEPDPGQPVALRKRYSYGSPVHGPDGCTQGVYETPYFLGIKMGKTKQTMEENENGQLVQAQVPCGEEYEPK